MRLVSEKSDLYDESTEKSDLSGESTEKNDLSVESTPLPFDIYERELNNITIIAMAEHFKVLIKMFDLDVR